MADACRAHEPAAQKALLDAFPVLGSEDLDDEQWTLVEKILGLSSMEAAIPTNMMRGIEDVAAKLVQDIEAGKADLSNLDIEAIGQRVLSQVDTSDVSAFAANLDRILPALGSMNK